MKSLSVFAVLFFMALSLQIGIAAPYFDDKGRDVYSDFRGDEANSPRNELSVRNNDYRDLYGDSRYEDVLESRREAWFNCRWCKMMNLDNCAPVCR